ncbi:MAG: hypothetical protein EZS28_027282 [Streblomastix strix]|uniref:Uncharacterized protein n=1 Tax=Streblomastix strix TaxID=222440 RepID=A0A5J4V475_9EUKA|nr:MAG: hypothetical protein EZS28_027282 [Streblomastix strix]
MILQQQDIKAGFCMSKSAGIPSSPFFIGRFLISEIASVYAQVAFVTFLKCFQSNSSSKHLLTRVNQMNLVSLETVQNLSTFKKFKQYSQEATSSACRAQLAISINSLSLICCDYVTGMLKIQRYSFAFMLRFAVSIALSFGLMTQFCIKSAQHLLQLKDIWIASSSVFAISIKDFAYSREEAIRNKSSMYKKMAGRHSEQFPIEYGFAFSRNLYALRPLLLLLSVLQSQQNSQETSDFLMAPLQSSLF